MILWALSCDGGKKCPLNSGVLCLKDSCGKKSPDVVIPRSISAHEDNLRELACVVTRRTHGLSLHHTRGGSMAESPFGTPGIGKKQNPALQIRLAMDLHVGTPNAIDGGKGVKTWEATYSAQVDLLNSTCLQLEYSVWMLAYHWASHLVQRRVVNFCAQSSSLFHRLSTPTTGRE